MKKSIITAIVLAWLSAIATFSQSPDPMQILAFSKTNGFRHGIIPQSLVTLGELGQTNNWEITATEDSLMFTPEVLNTIDVVVFLHTSGNILGSEQQKALKEFVSNGGGVVTLHTGTITENKWPWFVETVGAIFTGHPPVQEGTLIIEDRNHHIWHAVHQGVYEGFPAPRHKQYHCKHFSSHEDLPHIPRKLHVANTQTMYC